MRFWTHVDTGKKGKIILKHESINEEGRETATLYALGALSQVEARAFESHIAEGCSACENEAAEFEQAAALIGLNAPAVTPPIYLRDMLVARIERETHTPSLPAHRAAVIPFPNRAAHTRSDKPTPSRSLFREALPWAVAASLLLACVYSLYLWQTERRNLQALDNKT